MSAAGAFWMTDPSFAYTNPVQPVGPGFQIIQQDSSTVAGPVAGEEKAKNGQDSALDAAVAQVNSPVETAKAENVTITKESGTTEIASKADIAAIEQQVEAVRADRPKNAASLAALVKAMPTNIKLSAEEHCLAGAVYFESKSESLAGQLAVARVVINRAKSGRFPSSICGVVYQPSQFSFVRGRSMPYINKAGQQWKNAVAITQIAMDNSWKSNVEGALFFHAKYVSPGWKLRRIASVDNHIFYR